MWLTNTSLRRPAAREIAAFVDTLGLRRLSYTSVGMTLEDEVPTGYHRTDDAVAVADWGRAVAAVQRWAMHDQRWAELVPPNPTIEPGRDVAVLARAAGPWWLAPARVVAVVDEPTRWGFAYGTLEGHVMIGEELFMVEQQHDGARFRITAISRPADRLATVGLPLIRRFQAKFVSGALSQVRKASA